MVATGTMPPLYRDEKHPKGNFVHITDHEAALAARDEVVRNVGQAAKWISMDTAPKNGSAIWAWCGFYGLCMPRCNRLGKWMTDAQYPTEVFPECWQPVVYPDDPTNEELAALGIEPKITQTPLG